MQSENSFEGGFSVVKGPVFAVAISLLGVVVFAVLLRSFSFSDKVIYPVNQVIKSLAVMLGVMLFVKGEKGWIKGGRVGLLFTAFSYLAFSAIGNDFSLSWLIVAELALEVFVGSLSGIVAVNIKS